MQLVLLLTPLSLTSMSIFSYLFSEKRWKIAITSVNILIWRGPVGAFTMAELGKGNKCSKKRQNYKGSNLYQGFGFCFPPEVITTGSSPPMFAGAGKSIIGSPLSAGKTGTSQSNASAWFSAYTPQIAASVSFFRDNATQSLNGICLMKSMPQRVQEQQGF